MNNDRRPQLKKESLPHIPSILEDARAMYPYSTVEYFWEVPHVRYHSPTIYEYHIVLNDRGHTLYFITVSVWEDGTHVHWQDMERKEIN